MTGPVAGASSSRSVVSLRDVTKRFSNGTLALSRMTMDIRMGEFVSLLGPSGCGKSTALRIIAGLGRPSQGTVDWPASRIERDGRPDADVGFVFQEPTLMPWKPVFDNAYLPLRLKGGSKGEVRDRVMAALETVGLKDFAKAYPRELSGGMRMRVSIARALVTDPKLLLMDEPFGALDEITRQKLNDDVLRLWNEKDLTVVFVTHSVFEAAYLSSRIAVMGARPGRVVSDMVLPRPEGRERDEAFRLSETYGDLCRTVSQALAGAMHAPPAGEGA
ncbi:NitT/TauT family transport system ATP-binding protein [Rhizobium sp. PP-F2F-G48]|uniref:ABC transporter ATP-binding protein n=1 Tax=Rhizobium sp. PP-F2F-G48 TaxID=2135651 RepID=UPI00104E3C41|nr:ABC transporter ATP-binding protein [Rhizobium sp. PP-F2F-G48]TCM50763.1 NitT/TauT family transport system ATP-binding protein [Rhizobium sp. PP-F2F-G48]